ncbi:endo-1,4-beta-xylanase C-like [Panicum miliaceum]|uniref:Endo-1,4-beta-xylanase C-like n=1 Tax=Panicum miliaceum TaxID=4540 RepID=A0A3L6T1D7_PANMI|nr:endo-1,4-beta-xylanase C-like [Panicum miliaceum]
MFPMDCKVRKRDVVVKVTGDGATARAGELRRPLCRREEPPDRAAHPVQGKFRHYDINNEILHGSFYQDKLGQDIRATVFKTAAELDPDALLFVNDYNVESMCDIRAMPEAYIQ